MSWRAWAWGPWGWGKYQAAYLHGALVFNRTESEPDCILIPGFADLHIHGAFGTDFMSASEAEMISLAERLEEEGYDIFLPTTVTAPLTEVERAIQNLPDHSMIPGFHLEGPFISHLHPGAQPPESILDFDALTPEWQEVFDDPRLKLITLAPEKQGAGKWIKHLAARGPIVSMGHADATFNQAEEGFESGVRHVTHTFNAMRPFHHREGGAAGYALLQDHMSCELIYDRHHVSRAAAELLMRAKPKDKVVAVSDSTMAAGMPEGAEFTMWGHEVVTREGTVRLKSNGALAGSSATLLDVFRNLAEDFDIETAVRACCINPRRVLGLDSMKAGRWIVMDEGLNIRELLPIR